MKTKQLLWQCAETVFIVFHTSNRLANNREEMDTKLPQLKKKPNT